MSVNGPIRHYQQTYTKTGQQIAMTTHITRDTRAFTLIEVLISITILCISLAVIMQLFSEALKLRSVSDDYTCAVFHSREKMEEILSKEKLQEGESEGNFGDGFSWKEKISLMEPEEERANLPFRAFKISVQILWQRESHKRQLKITTVHLTKKTKNNV